MSCRGPACDRLRARAEAGLAQRRLTRALPRFQAFGANQETHGRACHFGASHRRFTGNRSRGHARA